jgi:hypothetical protein
MYDIKVAEDDPWNVMQGLDEVAIGSCIIMGLWVIDLE